MGKNATRDFPKFSVAGGPQHICEALPIRAHAWVMPERALDRDQVPTHRAERRERHQGMRSNSAMASMQINCPEAA
jgi:hypothetical protein